MIPPGQSSPTVLGLRSVPAQDAGSAWCSCAAGSGSWNAVRRTGMQISPTVRRPSTAWLTSCPAMHASSQCTAHTVQYCTCMYIYVVRTTRLSLNTYICNRTIFYCQTKLSALQSETSPAESGKHPGGSENPDARSESRTKNSDHRVLFGPVSYN